jgi:SET domain-containing protein
MTEAGSSYLSPGLTERLTGSDKGLGTFATRAFKKGDVLAVFGGDVVTYSGLSECSTEQKSNCVQISEYLYLVPTRVGFGDHINHSCMPNAGIQGQIILVAMRDIQSDEEICYDYAMTDVSDYDEFSCLCHSPECRGKITGNDWKRPELQKRYEGYFSSYVASLLD